MNYKPVFLPLLILLAFAASSYAAEAGLTLSDAENSAVSFSPRLKSVTSEQKAYEQRALGQKTQLYPRLTLDGSYKYMTGVPEISLPLPGAAKIKLGDNSNYSLGPALNWTALDFGGIKNAGKSAAAAAEAKRYEAEALKRQVVLALRSAYFQVAFANEQAALYTDALKLANAQYEDIRLNVRAGTRSRADELKAHQEVLSRMKLLRQAKSDLYSALRDLSAVTGNDHSNATLESIDSLLPRFKRFAGAKLDLKHPGLEALSKYAQSAEYSKNAAGALYWPRLQLSARSSLDYPNGPVLESFNQNTFGAAFSWALFESGATKNRVNENDELARTSVERKEQLESDMERDWDKTIEQLSGLEEQQRLNEISVSETGELSVITYKAYKTGAVSFIEVENANFKALEAGIQSAKTKVQMLMNLAVLAGMAE